MFARAIPRTSLAAVVVLAAAVAACDGAATPRAAPTVAAPFFTDVSAEAGLGGFRHRTGARGDKWFPETLGSGAAFLDYDGDRRLDLLLVTGGAWSTSSDPALRLYRNDGGGRFVEATAEAGFGEVRAYGFGAWVADYDGDHDPDVFLTALGDDLLLRNDGGVFREVGEAAGVAGGDEWSTAAVFFDADGDGWLDLWVGRYVEWAPEGDLWCSLDGRTKSYCTPELYPGTPARFYHNRGDGTFEERTAESGLGAGRGKTLGALAIDYDADGRQDLYVANDTEANLLFRNLGGGRFEEVGRAAGVAFDENGRSRAGMGVEAGVVDGMGLPTMFVGNFSKEMIGVFRYRGDGTFVDRAAESRIGMASLLTLTFGLAAADFDLDGDLDLLAANGHVQEEVYLGGDGITHRQPSHLFLNDGTGRFTDAASTAGASAASLLARGAAVADYDGDGDTDLLVTENGGPVHLWRNETAGRAGASWLRVTLAGAVGNTAGIGARVTVDSGGRRMEREIRAGGSYLSTSAPVAAFGLAGASAAERVTVRWLSGGCHRVGTGGGRRADGGGAVGWRWWERRPVIRRHHRFRRLTTAVLAMTVAAGCGSERVELRSRPEADLSAAEVAAMLREHGLYDANRHPGGSGLRHRWRVGEGGCERCDGVTGLCWQQGGSERPLLFAQADEYVRDLDANRFCGFSGWRLPTLEEAMSLLEPEARSDGLHVDPGFDGRQWWIWTADREGPVGSWTVTFFDGGCLVHVPLGGGAHVRAVRTEVRQAP